MSLIARAFISVKCLFSIFAGDLAAVRIIGVSVIERCPQGESSLYFYKIVRFDWQNNVNQKQPIKK